MIGLVPVTKDVVFELDFVFKEALKKSAPPFVKITDSKIDKVLQSMSSGEMTGWLVSEGETLLAVAITKVVEDPCLETKDLLIYCVYALKKISIPVWDEAFRQMADYGLRLGCTSMTAYSMVDKIRQMAVRMGGQADMVYINIPLKGEDHVH